jgi:hypothetical protein
MRDPREELPPLTVPMGQESTHEIFVKHYEGTQQREDEITRRLVDKAWDGTRRSYYRNGNLWCEDTFREGRLWSIEADFLPDGRPVEGVSIAEGKGHQKVYSEEGILDSEGDRLNGYKEGHWVYFHPNGETRGEEHWREGQLTGLRRFTHQDGTLALEEEYTPTSYHHKKFHPSGALALEGSHLLNSYGRWVKCGLWRECSESGVIKLTQHNDDGYNFTTYYDPESVLAASHRHTEVKEQAKAMLAACEGSAVELNKALYRLEQTHRFALSIPLRVALVSLPSQGFFVLNRDLQFGGKEAAALLSEERAALLQNNPEGLVCASVLLASFKNAPTQALPEEFDRLLCKAAAALRDQKEQNLGEGRDFQAMISLLPLSRREAIVFGGAQERPSKQVWLDIVGACPTEVVLAATLQRLFAPPYEKLCFTNQQSVYGLMQSLGEVAVSLLALLDLTSIAADQWRLLTYLGLLSATKSPQAATRLSEFISHKNAAVAKVAKTGLVALGDQALAALEEEIKRQSGPKQARAAQILAALPKSAAKKASAMALVPLTQGKTAEYLTKAAK